MTMVGMVSLFDSFEPEDVPRHGDLHGAYGLARLLALPGIGPKRALKLADRTGGRQR